MRPKEYRINLSKDEREQLQGVVRSRNVAPTKRLRAQILLKCDERTKGKRWVDREISEAYDASVRTIQRVRKRFLESGIDKCINGDYGNRPYVRKVDGEIEASLIAICCGPAPEGHARWTLKLLSNKLVELEVLEEIHPSTVHRVLKKTNLNLGAKNSGV
jgi:transposase